MNAPFLKCVTALHLNAPAPCAEFFLWSAKLAETYTAVGEGRR